MPRRVPLGLNGLVNESNVCLVYQRCRLQCLASRFCSKSLGGQLAKLLVNLWQQFF